MDDELPEPVLDIDEDLSEPILLIESEGKPGSYFINLPVKKNIQLKIIKENPVKKCKLNAKKIYKIYEDEQQLKAQQDVLVVALREIKADKSVSFNKNAGLKRIESASATLNLTKDENASFVTQWNWLAANRKNKGSTEFKGKESAFFSSLTPKRKKLKYPKYEDAQVLDWIKHSAQPILDVICEVADSEVTALELWVSAYKEGLSGYVREDLRLKSKETPTKTQLNEVSIESDVDGFQYLGLDDFYADYNAKKYPLKQFLPKSYDLSKLLKRTAYNEQTPPRLVEYAAYQDMKMAIQALKANYQRRKQIFLDDVKQYDYTPPKKDEKDILIYWIYVYSNVGIYGGKKSLREYKDKRVLSDWIEKGKYKNSIKVYESYKLAEELGLFQ